MPGRFARLLQRLREHRPVRGARWSAFPPPSADVVQGLIAPLGAIDRPGPEPIGVPTSVRRLLLVRALQVLGPTESRFAVDAATAAVADGVDGAPLVELASSYRDADAWRVEALLVEALRHLGWETTSLPRDAAALFATRAWAANVLDDTATGWELGVWVRTRLGEIDTGPLVDLGFLWGMYDDFFEGGVDEAPDAEGMAHALLATTSDPSPAWRVTRPRAGREGRGGPAPGLPSGGW